MSFDLARWRDDIHQLVADFAADPQGALARAGTNSLYGFLLGSAMLPVVAAYAADPATAIVALSGVVGSLGINLVSNLMQKKYEGANALAVVAQEAQDATLAPAYEKIAQELRVMVLAEQALAQAGQTVVLEQLRDELRRLGKAGQFAGASISVQQSGGVNFGLGTTIGSIGDVIGRDKIGGDKNVAQGDVNLSEDARINGVAVGINLGRIVYGHDPEEDERRRLVWYLARLASKLSHLPLRGLEERLDQGEGLALPQVYVELATNSRVSLLLDEDFYFVGQTPPDALRRYFVNGDPQQPLEPGYHPDHALPSDAIYVAQSNVSGHGQAPDAKIIHLWRAVLVTEVVRQNKCLVLLGDPGGGKSTFLRYLAWALARCGLDQRDKMSLHGWDDQHIMLPIIQPLRRLADRLERDGVSDTTVYASLRDQILACNVPNADYMLNAALHRGAALLLFDGLDEVPLDRVPGVSADRLTTLAAVRSFARLYGQIQVVVTCRTHAFDEDLHTTLRWHIETIAPLTLGQVRHFVPAWYAELTTKGQLEVAQAQRLTTALVDAIIDPLRPQLRALAANPLLLTMMALILSNKGMLPRDRPQLYEQVLELLLGQWDQVRDGPSLAERLELPGLTSERLRPLLDQLSYAAHAGATSADGRGRLGRAAVRDALIDFFAREHRGRAWELAQRCLDYIEQRSGLLTPDGPDSYVFAHLTLQEHCAGRHLVRDREAVGLILGHRNDTRWREPIFLGLGVIQPANPWLIESLLRRLIDRDEAERPKPIERWERDLILAAEIGQDRDWAYLHDLGVEVGSLQRDLRRGLVALLQDAAQPLPIAERVRAGFLLGDLGDPRVPIALDEWRRELARVQQGDTHGYFCRVEPGTYIIGSRDDDPDADDDEKPQHTVTFDTPFLIARYPICNAQWRTWVEQASGRPSYYADASDLKGANQPVVGVDWQMCNAFCEWLSAQLGVMVRLPTEQEWEAAARGGDARPYPWGEDWLSDRAATKEDLETRGHHSIVPMGCYVAGAAPCGALDMAGNIWEWTASVSQFYPVAKKSFTVDGRRVLRGGGGRDAQNHVRCATRYSALPVGRYDYGFRVLVALPPAQ